MCFDLNSLPRCEILSQEFPTARDSHRQHLSRVPAGTSEMGEAAEVPVACAATRV